MTAESGLPWNSPFARCTACVSHCFVEMTAVRSVYSKWIVRRPGLAGQMVTPQRIDNEVVVDGPRCICKVRKYIVFVLVLAQIATTVFNCAARTLQAGF